MTTRTHRKAGFTLLELLVIIGILALLAAIAVGTYFRIQESETVKATEARIRNIQAGLDRQWTAVLDTAREEFKKDTNGCASKLIPYCDGDRDRALSLWLYLKVRNEFPQTFAEAHEPVVLRDAGNTVVLTLPPKSTFVTVPNIAPSNDEEAARQSAVLLRKIVLERGTRGEIYGEEAVGAGGGDVTVSGGTFPVFRDLWGSPLAYIRFGTNPEIDSPPFSKPGVSRDPFDPRGKLTQAWVNREAAARAVFRVPGRTDFPTIFFPGAHWMITVISAGPEKDIARIGQAILNPLANGLVPVTDDEDDILGYRLRREGQGGN